MRRLKKGAQVVWLSRDKRGWDDVQIHFWSEKPNLIPDGQTCGGVFESHGQVTNYMHDSCCDQFSRVTGLSIAKGECIKAKINIEVIDE